MHPDQPTYSSGLGNRSQPRWGQTKEWESCLRQHSRAAAELYPARAGTEKGHRACRHLVCWPYLVDLPELVGCRKALGCTMP